MNIPAGTVYGIGVTVDAVRYNIELTNSTGSSMLMATARTNLVEALNAFAFPPGTVTLKAYPVTTYMPGLLIVMEYDAEAIGSIVVSRSTNNGTTGLTVNPTTIMHTSDAAALLTTAQLEHQAYVASHPDASGTGELAAATAAVLESALALASASSDLQQGATALTTALQTPLTSGSSQSADPTVGVTLASLAGFFMGKASGDQAIEREQRSVQADAPRTSDGVTF